MSLMSFASLRISPNTPPSLASLRISHTTPPSLALPTRLLPRRRPPAASHASSTPSLAAGHGSHPHTSSAPNNPLLLSSSAMLGVSCHGQDDGCSSSGDTICPPPSLHSHPDPHPTLEGSNPPPQELLHPGHRAGRPRFRQRWVAPPLPSSPPLFARSTLEEKFASAQARSAFPRRPPPLAPALPPVPSSGIIGKAARRPQSPPRACVSGCSSHRPKDRIGTSLFPTGRRPLQRICVSPPRRPEDHAALAPAPATRGSGAPFPSPPPAGHAVARGSVVVDRLAGWARPTEKTTSAPLSSPR